MRIIIHAGTNKTGSTAIQETCDKYREDLYKLGILYPSLGKRPHHSELLLAILEDDEYRGNFNRNDPEGRKAGITRSEEMWLNLGNQLSLMAPEILLLSSEFIFGLRPTSLESLIRRLQAYSENISAIVYIRDPCDHYLSSSQQILKYGAQVKDPRQLQDYSSKLSKMERYLPKCVEARKFCWRDLYRNDVCCDLLSRFLPLEAIESLNISPSASNMSLSAESMSLLRRFNLQNWGTRRIVGNRLNMVLLEAIKAEEMSGEYTKPVLKSEIHELVRQVHLKDMLILREQWHLVFDSFDYKAPAIKIDINQDRFSMLEVSDIVSYEPDQESKLDCAIISHLIKRIAPR